MGQGRSSLLGQMVGCPWATANEGFLGPDVFGFFEFLELQSQAAVGHVQPLFQSREVVRPIELECRKHTQPQGAMNRGIETVEVNRLHGE